MTLGQLLKTGLLLLTLLPANAIAGMGLAMHGQPKYKPDFTNFSYTNADAPQGGMLRLPVIGNFNSLNPYLIRGIPAAGLNLVYQTLLSRARDEPFTLYANLASEFQIAPDRRWISFTIDADARFSDGTPITATDILYSYKILRAKGRPNHRQYYSTVQAAEILSPKSIKFTFKPDAGREMPLILGLMPVLSKSYFAQNPFTNTSLVPPVGSGPYKIDSLEAGRRITYVKNPDFWGKGRAQYRGRYNFRKITFEYFRDRDVAFQAFLGGDLDVFFENNPAKWSDKSRYGSQPVRQKTIDRKIPPPMRALAFNTRKEIFSNQDVRRALTLAYDFNWINKNLLHGLYTRTSSFFQNTPLQAKGLPSRAELALLKPFRSEFTADLLHRPFTLPETNGSGRNRVQLTTAKTLLKKAGWVMSKAGLKNAQTGAKFEFEILLADKNDFKILSSFQKNLAKLGITAKLRLMDSAGYQNRINNFDFDMIIARWGQSLSPGNEQAFYWSSNAAKMPGSRNYPGISLKSVDFLVDRIAKAVRREELETATRALDRVLLWGTYVIPLQHINQQWLYYWPRIQFPETASNYGTSLDIWWQAPIDERLQKTQ